MRRVLPIISIFIVMMMISYFSFYYYASASDGVKMGDLVKMEHRGMLFKSWEGAIQEGGTSPKVFSFSVLDSDKKVIEALNTLQGQYIKVHYRERYRSFPWWGESHFFVVQAEKAISPFSPPQP
ncbi:MAG TPA: hypothetical protein VK476_04115 [Flavobacterium sp.]|nr:hypothetical protein [Flavobacterium sp.]